MRHVFQFSMLCLAVGLLSGCAPEEVLTSEDIPTAGVRFIHAVPDTSAFDFRAVDIVENTAFYGVAFRGTGQVFYKNARAGERHFRIFLAPDRNLSAAEQQAMAQTVVQDITTTLVAGHLYTFIIWGYARPGSSPGLQLTILEDDVADPGTQVALRIVNALPDSVIDGFQYVRGAESGSTCPGGATPPAAPTWTAVPVLTASGYTLVDPARICYGVELSSAGTPLFSDQQAITGSPPNFVTGLQALPGTTQAGSAVSGFVFPPSVAGSKAPSFTTPGIVFFWDRRPPNPPGF